MPITFEYSGDDYTLPDGLAEFTVEKQQEWSAAYGYDLIKRSVETQGILDAEQKKLARALLFMDEITMGLAFHSTIPLEEVRAGIDLADIINLLAESQIAFAIQGTYMPLPGYAVATPETVTIDEATYVVVSPIDSVNIEALTHAEFVVTLQLAEYLLELSVGDWSHFHILCAGYVRVAGEALTDDLIAPEGSRALLMKGMDMQAGMGLAQYFISQTSGVVSVLDRYTLDQIGAPS